MNSKVSIVKCNNYNPSLVLEATRKAIDLIGGITAFVKPESKVLVKPNLLMAKEPEFGVDTHPQVVRAVVKILKGINCKIYIGDGPSVWGRQIKDVEEVYEKAGMKRLAQQENVELVKFDKRRIRAGFPLTTWLDECDYLVSIPKFKTHNLMTLTGAIKNLYGLVWGSYKTELHRRYFEVRDFAKILVDIYQESRPQLTVVDGIVAMEGDGPGTSGKLRNTDLLLAGSDCVALDSILALIMGLEPYDILTTREAAKRGLGAADIKRIQIMGEGLKDARGKPFKLPVSSITMRLPKPIIEIVKKLMRFYPKVKHNNCIRCGACIQACPNKIISMKNNRVIFDYSGCISCFCCQEVCPASAIKVKKSVFSKLIGI